MDKKNIRTVRTAFMYCNICAMCFDVEKKRTNYFVT
jgi:hypothetical protein